MIDENKYSVLGVDICAVDYEAAVEATLLAAQERRAFSLSALAVHGVMTGVHDPEHLYRLNHLDMVVPDGQPVRWALRWLHGISLPDRVYGPRLMLELCRQAAERSNLSIFLFGSTAEVLSDLQANLLKRFCKIEIAGCLPSRFRTLTPGEASDLACTIRDSGAALTFVGLGCPRQEVWAYEFAPRLSMPVVAVGAAFDFHAGSKPQAPQGLQRIGLEWLYRLLWEPKRLWRRYVLLNPEYVGRLIVQKALGWGNSEMLPPKRDVLYG